jgi:hypothetical protein
MSVILNSGWRSLPTGVEEPVPSVAEGIPTLPILQTGLYRFLTRIPLFAGAFPPEFRYSPKSRAISTLNVKRQGMPLT